MQRMPLASHSTVMPELGSGIHAFGSAGKKGVDGPTKSGHDDRVFGSFGDNP